MRHSTGKSPSCVDVELDTDWQAVLEKQDMIVHLAVRIHMMQNTADPLVEFRREICWVGIR